MRASRYLAAFVVLGVCASGCERIVGIKDRVEARDASPPSTGGSTVSSAGGVGGHMDAPLATGGAGLGGARRDGAVGTGGIVGTGGTDAADAPVVSSGGISGTGGADTGGTGGSDAADAPGVSAGGISGSGGIAGTGGMGAGGIIGTGGVDTGGTVGSGGIIGTGGVDTGGIIGMGGIVATGGADTGGTVGSGGIIGTGGTIGTGGSIACTPETENAFCSRLGVRCGPATGQDNCGISRTVTCGACGTCTDPIDIPDIGGTFSGSTSGTSSLSSTCGGATAPEKVFRWIPSVSGQVYLSTCSSSFDTVLNVVSGSCTGGTAVACNNDSSIWCGAGTTNHSSVTFNAVAGTTYFVTVDGASTASGNYSFTAVSANGTCAVPYEVPAAGVSATYYMTGSNQDSASCGGTGADRVHHWRPAVSGTARVSAVTTYWPATLYVRSGTCKGAQVACDNQNGQWPTNNVSFAVTAGTDYYIWAAHGSYVGQAMLAYTLTVTPPSN